MNTKRIAKEFARVYFNQNTNHTVIQSKEYLFWQVERFYLRNKSSHFMSSYCNFKKGNVKESERLFERD